MKKKTIFALLLMLALAAILCACGGEAEGKETVTTPVVTLAPILEPTAKPTVEPTPEPAVEPTPEPTVEPTSEPAVKPALEPTQEPAATSSPSSTEVSETVKSTEPVAPPTGQNVDNTKDVGKQDVDLNTPNDTPDDEIEHTSIDLFDLESIYDPWDFEGHVRAERDGYLHRYREWCALHMDYVEEFCSTRPCTVEEYIEHNSMFDE